MSYQTSSLAILLQNRTAFYEVGLARLPNQKIASLLSSTNTAQDIVFTGFEMPSLDSDLMTSLILQDPLKKPELGSKWGRTFISYGEFFDRARQLEMLVITACREIESANSPLLGELRRNAEKVLLLLSDHEDSLRYHRLRLVNPEK